MNARLSTGYALRSPGLLRRPAPRNDGGALPGARRGSGNAEKVGTMKREYDFSNAERGKFHRPEMELLPPVHLEPGVLKW